MSKYSLLGVCSHTFGVMAYIKEAMKEHKYRDREIENYCKKCLSGDYDNVLKVSQEMIDELNIMEEVNN